MMSITATHFGTISILRYDSGNTFRCHSNPFYWGEWRTDRHRVCGRNIFRCNRYPASDHGGWLGEQDSNLYWRSQSPQSYRWTIPHSRSGILARNSITPRYRNSRWALISVSSIEVACGLFAVRLFYALPRVNHELQIQLCVTDRATFHHIARARV